ncbi:hypothetical protein B6G00_04845 [Salinivibrio sp. YCSC6]|nr:hypothetical protein B6G00_04845 [Salinivibrio sp. YCSC6]
MSEAPCNGRAAYIVIMIGIVLALVRPTPGLYIGGAIGDDDTSPGILLDMGTLSTGASCTAPVTIGAKFNIGAKFGRQCRRRALAWVFMINTAPALVRPTPGLYIDDPIGVGDTSPRALLDMGTLSTGACHDRRQF